MFLLCLTLCIASLSAKTEDNHETGTALEFSIEQQKEAGIQVTIAKQRDIIKVIELPGEVVLNKDQVSIVSAMIQAKVTKSYVFEGQKVNKGDPLIILSSPEVAALKASLILASQDKKRKNILYKKGVATEKSTQEANILFDKLFSTLLTYGFEKQQVENFLKSEKADASFVLLSPFSGTIVQTDITLGQTVKPERLLFKIVNEDFAWVDASIPSKRKVDIKVGMTVSAEKEGTIIQGKVISIQHEIDQSTRTRIIRISMDNSDDLIHVGEFIRCRIQIPQDKKGITVPLSATVTSSEGKFIAYVQDGKNHFRPMELEVSEEIENFLVVTNIKTGTKFVEKGVFYVDSEFKKQSFSVHGH